MQMAGQCNQGVTSLMAPLHQVPVTIQRCCLTSIGLPLNTLRLRQHGRHFADDIFKRIFLNGNVRISIKLSLKFDPQGPSNNIPAFVQIMAWRRPGDKPLSESMLVSLLTHICVIRPQWVKKIRWSPGGHHNIKMWSYQYMDSHNKDKMVWPA